MYNLYLQQAQLLLAIFFSVCVIFPEQVHFNNFNTAPFSLFLLSLSFSNDHFL